MSTNTNRARVVVLGGSLSATATLALIAQLKNCGAEVVDEATLTGTLQHQQSDRRLNLDLQPDTMPPWNIPRIETKNPFQAEHRANLKRHAALAKSGGRTRR